jgi:hypothetical protein
MLAVADNNVVVSTEFLVTIPNHAGSLVVIGNDHENGWMRAGAPEWLGQWYTHPHPHTKEEYFPPLFMSKRQLHREAAKARTEVSRSSPALLNPLNDDYYLQHSNHSSPFPTPPLGASAC